MFTSCLFFLLRFLKHCITRFFQRAYHRIHNFFEVKPTNTSSISNFKTFKNGSYNGPFVLQDKEIEFMFKVGLIEINAMAKINSQVEGLENIEANYHNYYANYDTLSIKVIYEVCELNIRSEGFVEVMNFGPKFLFNTILKNVEFQIDFDICSYEQIKVHIDYVHIKGLNINAQFSGKSPVNWVLNLLISITVKFASMLILNFLEILMYHSFKKMFSKITLSQKYFFKKVCDYVDKKKPNIAFFLLKTEDRQKNFEFYPDINKIQEFTFEMNKNICEYVLEKLFVNNFKYLNLRKESSDSFESELTMSQVYESSSEIYSPEKESVFAYSVDQTETSTNTSRSFNDADSSHSNSSYMEISQRL